jgi:hypothetical protein
MNIHSLGARHPLLEPALVVFLNLLAPPFGINTFQYGFRDHEVCPPSLKSIRRADHRGSRSAVREIPRPAEVRQASV